jgi:hypothetical protein
MLTPSKRLQSIRAKGSMVELVLSDNTTSLIRRDEAIHRAKAIIAIDKNSQGLVAALVTAADQARKNETGQGYAPEKLQMLLAVAKDPTRIGLEKPFVD